MHLHIHPLCHCLSSRRGWQGNVYVLCVACSTVCFQYANYDYSFGPYLLMVVKKLAINLYFRIILFCCTEVCRVLGGRRHAVTAALTFEMENKFFLNVEQFSIKVVLYHKIRKKNIKSRRIGKL